MNNGISTTLGNNSQQVEEDEIGSIHSDSEPGTKRKRVRGPTCMPKIWAQPKGKRISVLFNEFGQPVDKDTTSQLSHFMGSLARSGKYCPDYKLWNKVDKKKKRKLLAFLHEKFDLPLGSDDSLLKSFGKKVRNWRARIKKDCYDPSSSLREQLNSKPKQVHEKQWKKLVKHWNKNKSKRVSDKNKENRAKKKMIQVTGKKSYARVREELKESLEGREPSRIELFSACFFKDGITKTVEAANAIELSEGSIDEPGPEDIFSKVMGKDQNGAARMYGQGVRASDVWGPIPSRSACHRENLHWKSICEKLSSRVADLESKVDIRGSTENASNGSSHVLLSPQNPVLANESRPLKMAVSVYLKSIINPTEIVAKGWIKSLDPNELVGGEEIGLNWCEVNVQVVIKRDERLVRPYGLFITIEDAIGATIAWPCTFISVARDEA